MVRSANNTVLGLALVTLGCVDSPGAVDTGETGSADDPSGDGDGDGDGDSDAFELVSAELDVAGQFGTPLDAAFCEYLTTYAGNYYPDYVALLVHHAPGDIPLTSADGEPLEAIGPEWVAQAFPVMTVPGEFLERLDPRIEIPCP